MKKILFIEFLPIGGSQVTLEHELDYLDLHYDKTYSYTVITSEGSTFTNRKSRNGKIYTLPFSVPQPAEINVNLINFLIGYTRTLIYLFAIVLKERPNLIHTNHYMWSIYANIIGYFYQIPVLIWICDVWPLQNKLLRYLMRFNPNSYYYVPSRFVFDTFTNKYHLPKTKTKLIYDGIDSNLFKAPTPKEIKNKNLNENKYLIYVSRINRERNIEIFIETAAILHDKYPQLKFHHWGFHPTHSDPEYYNDLTKLVRDLKISSCFKFKKFAGDQTKMPEFIRKAYLSIITASQFALPNVAIESMMSGTPVIAFNVGGNPEVIKNDQMGSLVESNSAILYAKAAEKYLKGEKDYVKTALIAIEFTNKNFRSEKKFTKLFNFYQEILNTKD